MTTVIGRTRVPTNCRKPTERNRGTSWTNSVRSRLWSLTFNSKIRFPLPSTINIVDKCREEIASALKYFSNRWCKREGVEDTALKEWKRSIFTIMDKRIKFYSQNANLLPPKPISSFRHLKQGIQEFRFIESMSWFRQTKPRKMLSFIVFTTLTP